MQDDVIYYYYKHESGGPICQWNFTLESSSTLNINHDESGPLLILSI